MFLIVLGCTHYRAYALGEHMDVSGNKLEFCINLWRYFVITLFGLLPQFCLSPPSCFRLECFQKYYEVTYRSDLSRAPP
jgi:hypothetical protein